MKLRDLQFKFPTNPFCDRLAILTCVALLSLGQDLSIAQQATPSPQTQSQQMATPTPTPTVIPEEAPKLSNDQLDSLVAPIALYPDLLLAQTLAASTYPLEVIQLQQWLERNKNLKDKKLVDAIAKKPWDPSVQSMAAYPEALQRMASNIEWTTELGNAFLAQQSDVMDAVQRMRAKAQNKGTLQTDLHQKVEKQTEGGKEVVTIEPADPEVVYVPYYDPEYIYGPPVYPYYPDHYPGYYPGMGLIWAAIILGPRVAHWGNCDWGHGDINIDINNEFNRNQVNPLGNRGPGNRGNRWQHNPAHRGNTPYADRRTNQRFGQANRGQSSRPAQGNRPSAGTSNRPSQLPSGGKGPSRSSTAKSTRPARGSASRPTTRPSGASATNRVGNRSVSITPSYSSRGGAFGGGMDGYRSSFNSSRGGYSMGGGGFSRGGFGGGGFRGGGGGGRR